MLSRILTYILLTAAILTNRIVVAEESVTGGISGNLNVTNCIVDNDNNFDQLTPSVNISYSIIRGTVAPAGTGNIALSDDTIISDIYAGPLAEDSYYLSNNSFLVNRGNPTLPVWVPEKDINGNVRNYIDSVDIGAVEYSMIFNKGNGNWNSSANWNIGRIPDEKDLVTILNETTIANNDAVCRSILSIGAAGKISVEPTAQLQVKGTINNTNADKLTIKASSTLSNGTLIFHNPENLPVYGTVQMYSVANLQTTATDTAYRWQYFGIPLRSVVASPTFNGSWVRKWNESSIEFSKWEELKNSDMLHSFSGYEVTQDAEKYIAFKGILENKDTTIVLNKSSVPFYAGQHVLSNPYTAAINISDVTFGINTEATVYIYNTGSYNDWNVDSSNGRIGDNSGQYTAVPQNVAHLVYPAIPSMQGFIIRATNDAGSITIPYISNTQNLIKQRAKSDIQNSFLTINLNSEHHTDRVWLLYEPTASRGFDNGWDGYKLKGSDNAALLYARESAGDLQVNSINDFNNINLHFRAGKDSNYELTIVNHNLSSDYPEMYLIDLKENKVTTIESDTTRYSFTASNAKATENRFRIMTGRSFEFNPVGDEMITISNDPANKEINIYNATGQTGNLMMYDLTGRMLVHQKLMPGLSTINTGNNSGVLITKASAGSVSKTTKMIVNY